MPKNWKSQACAAAFGAALLAPNLIAGAFAQQVSPPIVSQPIESKAAQSEDVRTLVAPVTAWQPGQPVEVRGDMAELGEESPDVANRPGALDPLVARSQQIRSQQITAAPNVAATVIASFEGIPATGVLPPDTIGDVGPNHYIQMVNSAFMIFDKSGHVLAGPSQINSLWRGFGGPCENQNNGDPVVRYDELADRWLMSQFAINDRMQCIAISRGPNPVTSGWFLYAFPTVNRDGQPVTPDYPKISVWPDGYYMSTQRGFPNGGVDVWVFERQRMLAGQPARQITFAVAAPSIVLLPSDLDGPAPPAGTPNFFVRQVDGERFGGQDRVEVFAFTTNWSNPAASTFTLFSTLPTAPFDSVLCSASLMGACVPQPGTAQTLETLTVWPMWRAQFRKLGSDQVLLFNHTVDATGADVAGVRWYELRRPNSSGAWTIRQQGTQAPSDGLHRWMGSIAMDADGDIALGYSVSSATVSPGIRAGIRAASDPLGTLSSEITLQNGSGSQTHPAARWGNYSSMDVDPSAPKTFWYTTEYYDSTSSAGWKTRIVAFQLSTPVAGGPPLAFGTLMANGQKASGTSNWTSAYNASLNRYEITLNGENYFYLAYASTVTPAGDARFCRTSSVSGKLLVYCYDHAGAPASSRFAFVVYKP